MNLGAVECTEGLFKVRLKIFQFLIICLAPIKSIDSKVAYLLNLAAKSTNRYNLIQKSKNHVIKVDPVAQIVELFGPKKYVCSCSRSHPGSYLA